MPSFDPQLALTFARSEAAAFAKLVDDAAIQAVGAVEGLRAKVKLTREALEKAQKLQDTAPTPPERAAAGMEAEKLEKRLETEQETLGSAETKAASKQAADVAAARLAILEKLAKEDVAKIQPDPASTALFRTYRHDSATMACRVDPQGRYIVASAQSNDLQRFDIITGERVAMAGHSSWSRGFEFADDKKTMVSACYDGWLYWWDINAPAKLATSGTLAHEGFARSVTISPDGQLAASGGNDNLVKIWSMKSRALVATLTEHTSHVYVVAFSPDGKTLASGDLNGVVKIWSCADWQPQRELDAKLLYKQAGNGIIGGVQSMQFSPAADSKLLAVCGITKVRDALNGVGTPTVMLFNHETGKLEKTCEAKGPGMAWSVRFHPTGQFLVATGGRTTGELWFFKPTEDKPSFSFTLPAIGYGVDFHPDGLRLAVALTDQTTRLYDLCPRPAAAEPASPT